MDYGRFDLAGLGMCLMQSGMVARSPEDIKAVVVKIDKMIKGSVYQGEVTWQVFLFALGDQSYHFYIQIHSRLVIKESHYWWKHD